MINFYRRVETYDPSRPIRTWILGEPITWMYELGCNLIEHLQCLFDEVFVDHLLLDYLLSVFVPISKSAELSRAGLLDLIVDKSEHPKAKFIFVQSEEGTKLRLLNRDVGFVICQTSTLGWSPLSEACAQCNYIDKSPKAKRSILTGKFLLNYGIVRYSSVFSIIVLESLCSVQLYR